MGYSRRTDKNLKEIVKTFRDLYCSVEVTNKEFDCIVGVNGYNLLIEVKDGLKLPSHSRLTNSQKERIESWKGIIHVVRSVDEVVRIVKFYQVLPSVKFF